MCNCKVAGFRCECKPAPHKHAALIKAWADGAKIQYLTSDKSQWLDVYAPQWVPGAAYRIKPVPKSLAQVCRDAYLNAPMTMALDEAWTHAADAVVAAYHEQEFAKK